jgi:hypothetical protein
MDDWMDDGTDDGSSGIKGCFISHPQNSKTGSGVASFIIPKTLHI